jgi:hypothetical protein
MSHKLERLFHDLGYSVLHVAAECLVDILVEVDDAH